MALFRRYSSAVVVHYSRYERTEYRKLADKYPDVASREEIEALFAPPRAFDLYSDVVRSGSEWPTHDFSIKSLAKHCGFSWRDADPSGASSIEWFDQWAKTGRSTACVSGCSTTTKTTAWRCGWCGTACGSFP